MPKKDEKSSEGVEMLHLLPVSRDVDLGSFLVRENSDENESYPDFINSESGQSSQIPPCIICSDLLRL